MVVKGTQSLFCRVQDALMLLMLRLYKVIEEHLEADGLGLRMVATRNR